MNLQTIGAAVHSFASSVHDVMFAGVLIIVAVVCLISVGMIALAVHDAIEGK